MSLGEIMRILLVGYPVPPEMVDPRYPAFFQQAGGLYLTLIVTALSLLLSAFAGIFLALCRVGFHGGTSHRGSTERMMWKVARGGAVLVTEVVRGIPIMILVLLGFYLPYPLFGVRVPPVILALIVFSVYGSVYFGEIFRSGLRAVDENCVDAGRVLGLNTKEIFLYVRLPIMVRTMAPAILGLAVTIFKDTSVLMVVAVPELTYSARQMQVAEPVNYALVLLLVLCIYWGVSFIGTMIVDCLDPEWGKKTFV